MLALPLGDTESAGFEAQAVGGGPGQSGADGGAFLGSSLFDRRGEVVGE